jgi:SWI/SNF-related matrix-associated actin-dependent regulator 1 of chromatin subfamily A
MAAEQLVAINALRRLAVEAKLGSVIAWLDDFKATGEKAVLFAWHRHTVEMLAERYCNGKKIYGGMTDTDKQAAIDSFQNDPHQQFLACSIRAAGVGINLTAASNVVFVEQGWNHAEMDQAADRCHRIGQQCSVTAWTLNASNTIDEDITDLIRVKRLESDLVVDGDLVTNKGTTLNGELLAKMIERNHD